MQRGFTKFHCTACGHDFTGPDYELACTVYTAPIPCPRCGSIRTLPKSNLGFLFGFVKKRFYKSIWDSWEKTARERKAKENNGQERPGLTNNQTSADTKRPHDKNCNL